MNFPELLKAFWFWWVTENNLYPYDPDLFGTRGVQLGFVVGGLVFIFAMIVSKKLRGRFF
jgi:hypothetical protein